MLEGLSDSTFMLKFERSGDPNGFWAVGVFSEQTWQRTHSAKTVRWERLSVCKKLGHQDGWGIVKPREEWPLVRLWLDWNQMCKACEPPGGTWILLQVQ